MQKETQQSRLNEWMKSTTHLSSKLKPNSCSLVLLHFSLNDLIILVFPKHIFRFVDKDEVQKETQQSRLNEWMKSTTHLSSKLKPNSCSLVLLHFSLNDLIVLVFPKHIFRFADKDEVQKETQQSRLNEWMKSTVNNDMNKIHLIKAMWLVRLAARFSECVFS